MIVGVDATPLTIGSGGLRRYTEELSRALAARFPADEFHLMTDQRVRRQGERAANLHLHTRRERRRVDRWWWSAGLPLRLWSLGCELFHGTDFAVPYLPFRPSVMTLHDLSPWLEAVWRPRASRVRRRTPYLLRLGIATMVITPTMAIRRSAIEMFDLPPERVIAVPEAAPAWFRPDPKANTPPYFLFVGTIEPRKNLSALIEAWRRIRDTHNIGLTVVGRVREDARAPAPEAGLSVLGEVDDRELPGLYSNAVATIYPSHYEGFGLPILEAMQCGSPVIASRDPAIVETSGGAALHVNAAEPGELVSAMLAMLRPEMRAAGAAASLRRAADFSWIRTAEATREVYVETIRRFAI